MLERVELIDPRALRTRLGRVAGRLEDGLVDVVVVVIKGRETIELRAPQTRILSDLEWSPLADPPGPRSPRMTAEAG